MKKLMILLLISIVSSCATQQFNLKEGKTRTIPDYEGKHHFIFWGIGQEKNVNTHEVCETNQQLEAVNSHLTFVDGLLTAFTWGIYYPRSYAVYCSKEE